MPERPLVEADFKRRRTLNLPEKRTVRSRRGELGAVASR